MYKFLTTHIIALLTALLTACSQQPTDNKSTVPGSTTDTLAVSQDTVTTDGVNSLDIPESDMATYFVVVADTGMEYPCLRKRMSDLNLALKIPIDTMGRYFNATKNLIALPDDDEDEIYAGDYFPRRFPSEHLSLEYLSLYKQDSGEKTIALVTGIYETEKSADSALAVLRQTETKVFKIKADLFIGCMH